MKRGKGPWPPFYGRPAEGRKCARSWKILPEVGSDPDYPDLTLRDADAMREFEARVQAAQ